MRIGVVSDTHNNLKNVRRIVELFNAADVQRVIHTGDISQAKTLDVLAGLSAPLQGCLLYTSPSPRDRQKSRMPSSA